MFPDSFSNSSNLSCPSGGSLLTLLAAPALGLALGLGCVNEPLDIACPSVQPGDLVITEIHGPQSGDAANYAEWVEIYNATSRTIDLAGLSIQIMKLDGSRTDVALVRSSTNVAAGEYAVLGRPTAGPAGHLDYNYGTDITSKLFDTGAITIFGCGQEVDQVVYRNLPETGSFGLDGNNSPSAEANDDEKNWCIDTGDPQGQFRGTPKMENITCPQES